MNHPFLVLVGAPNSGKTTLYNWLTASKFATVNYPGSTVDFSKGELAARWGGGIQIADSPGSYSLFPKSEDELVTKKLIFDEGQDQGICGVVLILDATQLSRQLTLAQQLSGTGIPMMIVITMMDVVRQKNMISDFSPLESEFNCKVYEFDGLLGGGLPEIVQGLKLFKNPKKFSFPNEWTSEDLDKGMNKNLSLVKKIFKQPVDDQFTQKTSKVDQYLLHPIFGLLFFFIIMSVMFSSVFWLAAPIMDLIDNLFSSVSSFVTEWSPNSMWFDFIGNGLIASAGAVLVFVPQIFILFFGIGLLGDSGYLARAASLIDKPLSKMGMNGRSFVPILSGFACAVPAMMACRNINSKRDRVITMFILPLLTCSARLPVYALLIGFLFLGKSSFWPGIVLAILYMGSILVSSVLAGVLNLILPKTEKGFFVLELPVYRRPIVRSTFFHALRRTKMYLKRAGVPIFIISTLIWVTSTFPHFQEKDPRTKISTSYLGMVGKKIEPILEPLGVDWRVGVGLLSAFAAREVFVSTLAIVFNASAETDGGDDAAITESLLSKMKEAVDVNGKPIFTFSTVIGLLIFFMIALQCTSTVAVSQRETGSWFFAGSQLILFNVLAYFFAVLAVKLAQISGFG